MFQSTARWLSSQTFGSWQKSQTILVFQSTARWLSSQTFEQRDSRTLYFVSIHRAMAVFSDLTPKIYDELKELFQSTARWLSSQTNLLTSGHAIIVFQSTARWLSSQTKEDDNMASFKIVSIHRAMAVFSDCWAGCSQKYKLFQSTARWLSSQTVKEKFKKCETCFNPPRDGCLLRQSIEELNKFFYKCFNPPRDGCLLRPYPL